MTYLTSKDKIWFEAMKAKGHMPIVDEWNDLEYMVFDEPGHNGPGCSACGWSCCWHCKLVSDIPECSAIEGQCTVKAETKEFQKRLENGENQNGK